MSKTNVCLVNFAEEAYTCGCPDCVKFLRILVLFAELLEDSGLTEWITRVFGGQHTVDAVIKPFGSVKRG